VNDPTNNPASNSASNSLNRKRPVNLDIGTIAMPIPALVSILHRASGVVLVVGVGILLWLLDWSLTDEESFNTVRNLFDSVICKLIIWGVLAALIYHTAAGVRHLIMDLGIGESLEGGRRSAQIVLVATVVLVVLVGACIW